MDVDTRRLVRIIAAGAGAAAGGAVMGRLVRRLAGPKLAGQVALVTGASRGLGLCIAEALADEGCKLCICARDEVGLAAARRRLEARGAEVLALPCDITRRESVQTLVLDAERRFGRIDVLVNNAGIIQVGPLDTMTLGDFHHALDVDFWGAVHASLAVLPGMRRRRSGRIVNITSIGGKVAVPHLLPYTCAKFALVGFSEGLRAELARDGVRVVTVVPGLMRTGSAVHVEYKGQPAREFAWFSLGDATPLTAMSARRAARRIVRAIRRGEAEVTLSWQAKLLRLVHALAPGMTSDLLGLMNRLLPGTPEVRIDTARGFDVRRDAPRIARLVDIAAEPLQQYAGSDAPPRPSA